MSRGKNEYVTPVQNTIQYRFVFSVLNTSKNYG